MEAFEAMFSTPEHHVPLAEFGGAGRPDFSSWDAEDIAAWVDRIEWVQGYSLGAKLLAAKRCNLPSLRRIKVETLVGEGFELATEAAEMFVDAIQLVDRAYATHDERRMAVVKEEASKAPVVANSGLRVETCV